MKSGTGDYFGPVVVCAALVTAEDLPLLQQLGVTDSKLLSDDAIRTCAPKLTAALRYSVLILDDDTYNRVHEHDNMVAIKCKLHNQAYVHLQRKAGRPARLDHHRSVRAGKKLLPLSPRSAADHPRHPL